MDEIDTCINLAKFSMGTNILWERKMVCFRKPGFSFPDQAVSLVNINFPTGAGNYVTLSFFLGLFASTYNIKVL